MDDLPHHRARKRFGQNFLHDRGVIDRIVKAAAPRGGECLLEIGPGQGALTGPLLAANGRLEAIEVDRDLAAALRHRFGGHTGFVLHEADVLKFDFSAIDCAPGALRIVGNLPYNISTPLIFRLLEQHGRIRDMLFMLQREVVERMAAGPGEPAYGRLSVMVQYHCKVELLFGVPPGAFQPRPKVESAIVRLEPWQEPPHPASDPRALERVVRTAFNQRRKTVRNALRSLMSEEQLTRLGIDSGLRPENLSLADYVRISSVLDGRS